MVGFVTKVKTIVGCPVRVLTSEDVRTVIFNPKGGWNLGVALARSAGAGTGTVGTGMVEAVARKRKRAVVEEMKLKPKI
jgi:hypothetical protein